MLTPADQQVARRPLYGCVRCGHSLTREEAYASTTGQRVGGLSYFCATHAPADAVPVDAAAHQQAAMS